MQDSTIPRRGLVQLGSLLGLGALISKSALAAGECRRSPAQTEGPYYPVTEHDDVDYDLTKVEGRDGIADGEIIVVKGKIQNVDCQPLAGALVDVWQANTYGKYDHPDDDTDAPLDPNFQYWARITTAADGTYAFRTIYPGLYPGRTRHIHYRVTAPGFRALTSQLYFAGVEENARDGIYRGLTAAQQRLVTTELVMNEAFGVRVGTFDVSLGARTSRRATPELD